MTDPAAFNTDPAVVAAALFATTVLVCTVAFALWCIGLIFRPINARCRSQRAGYRCVHWEGHPGSHRDESGEYWNDRNGST